MILMFIKLSNCLFSDGLFDGTMLLVILLSLSETSSHLYLVIRLPGALVTSPSSITLQHLTVTSSCLYLVIRLPGTLVTSPIKYHFAASSCDIILLLPGDRAAWAK